VIEFSFLYRTRDFTVVSFILSRSKFHSRFTDAPSVKLVGVAWSNLPDEFNLAEGSVRLT